MSTETFPFGQQPEGAKFSIKCLGCKREFPGMAEYRGHHCPEPNSGEAYR